MRTSTLLRALRAASLPLLAALCGPLDAAPIMSVPPAANRAPAATRAQPALQLPAAAPAARTISLPPPASADLSHLNALPRYLRQKRDIIGLGRDVPASDARVDLAALAWQRSNDGGRVANLRVESGGAAALRVALRMNHGDPDVTVRIAAAASGAVLGEYPANLIAQVSAEQGEWWSPVVDGSAAIVEISAPAGARMDGSTLTIARLSHLTRAGNDLKVDVKDSGPGSSGACELNWKCVVPQTAALTNAANAVARMVFTQKSGDSFLCSGTLINDSQSTLTPYFATAAHCMDSDYVARNLELFWFFDAPPTECSVTPNVDSVVRQASGAHLIANNIAEDWSLVRLNAAPPGGVHYAAWNAAPFQPGPAIDLHHPSGDTKKHSAGSLVPGPDGGYEIVEITREDDDAPLINAPLIPIHWTQGVTEGGSSGSGLLTFKPNGGYYEVRGALTGGASSCSDPDELDYYSRMDRMITVTRDYLAPGSMPANQQVVVEYYNAALDHYFMTASAIEMNALDTGAFVGWVRTGARFIAYNQPVAGASPVCRFYQAPGYGDSHFYSASPAECATLINNPRFPGWIYESGNVFYVVQPNQVTGACAAGTHPLWRFFHAAVTNHRYTGDISLRDRMRQDPAWTPEGYGPDAVIMCAPNGS